MLLRNLDAPKMVNGTRLIVRRLFPNCILAEIITRDYAGEEVFIPRISLQPTNYLIEFKRLQFPVRVCYTLTSKLHKAQGKSNIILEKHSLNAHSNCNRF